MYCYDILVSPDQSQKIKEAQLSCFERSYPIDEAFIQTTQLNSKCVCHT